MRHSLLACVALASTFTAPVLAQQQPRPKNDRITAAFIGVNVVQVETGEILPAHTVVVVDGRIERMGPSASVAAPRDATVIEGAGLFLMPGMISLYGMASEIGPGVWPEDALLLYLAKGVTTVRLRGSPSDDLKKRTDEGLPAPRPLFSPAAAAPVAAGIATGPVDWLLGGRLGPMPISPVGLVRALTIEPAEDLGIASETSSIEVGFRADLVLLGGNPLESAANLENIRGVMTDGRWWSDSALAVEAEWNGRAQVLAYQKIEAPPATGPSCVGNTLFDCLGGEQQCASGGGCDRGGLFGERAALRRRLDYLARIAPSSDWIAGQRVNAAIENRDFSLATAVADSCGGTLWWCQALRGYTRHWQRPGSGDAQFDSVTANAPPGTLAWVKPGDPGFDDRTLECEWHDLKYLISGDFLGEFNELPCGKNLEFEARYWWLADPLWSVPGNARHGEHFARIVQMRLHDDQNDGTYGAHVQSHHWSVMAAGLANSWRTVSRTVLCNPRSRSSPVGPCRELLPDLVDRVSAPCPPGTSCPSTNSTGSRPVTAAVRELYVNHAYRFTPSERLFRDPLTSTPDDWRVEKGDEASRFDIDIAGAPGGSVQSFSAGKDQMVMAEDWYNLESQTAALRRGDRMLVMAAALPPTLLPSVADVEVNLVFGRPSDRSVQVFQGRIETGGIFRAQAELADEALIESLEVTGPGWVGRMRRAVSQAPLVNGFGISEPVLVTEDYEVGGPLLDAMLPTTDLGERDVIGVYFEAYGATSGETLRIDLTATRVGQGVLARFGGAIGLGRPGSLGTNWEEVVNPDASGIFARTLAVSLSGLDSGEYRLMLRATRSDGTTSTSSREFSVSK